MEDESKPWNGGPGVNTKYNDVTYFSVQARADASPRRTPVMQLSSAFNCGTSVVANSFVAGT